MLKLTIDFQGELWFTVMATLVHPCFGAHIYYVHPEIFLNHLGQWVIKAKSGMELRISVKIETRKQHSDKNIWPCVDPAKKHH